MAFTAKNKGQVPAAFTFPTVLDKTAWGEGGRGQRNASMCFHVSVCFSRESGHHGENFSHPLLTEDRSPESHSSEPLRSFGFIETRGCGIQQLIFGLCL